VSAHDAFWTALSQHSNPERSVEPQRAIAYVSSCAEWRDRIGDISGVRIQSGFAVVDEALGVSKRSSALENPDPDLVFALVRPGAWREASGSQRRVHSPTTRALVLAHLRTRCWQSPSVKR
jgi:hypothetical protein